MVGKESLFLFLKLFEEVLFAFNLDVNERFVDNVGESALDDQIENIFDRHILAQMFRDELLYIFELLTSQYLIPQ